MGGRLIWSPSDSLAFLSIHFVSFGLTVSHVGLTCCHLMSQGTRCHMFSLDFIWFRLLPFSLALLHREKGPLPATKREKGKLPAPKREKGKVETHNFVRFPPYNQAVRMHARTNQTKRTKSKLDSPP